jgi:hypothetical protein
MQRNMGRLILFIYIYIYILAQEASVNNYHLSRERESFLLVLHVFMSVRPFIQSKVARSDLIL